MAGDGLALFEDEKILKVIKPHFLAFYDMYLLWIWIAVVSLAFIFYGDTLVYSLGDPLTSSTGYAAQFTSMIDNELTRQIPVFTDILQGVDDAAGDADEYANSYTKAGLWFASIVLSALVVSVLKIEFKWVFIMLAVGLGSLAVTSFLGMLPESAMKFGILSSIIGSGFVELYRRAHTFFITDQRIITEVEFIDHKRNELSYDKINNIVLSQNLIGRLLDFGTIIPVTASGLGMGGDFSAVSVGVAGRPRGGPMVAGGVTGGRYVQTPRVRSMYCLFGITNPCEVEQLISEQLHGHIEAPYLRKMTRQLEDLRKSMEK
ncbi:MAG: PH domain-containing protein [Candidatus Altiarchaeales archaeon]|nr:PH domain-containing protein [Candidatus Altiarchaeales archaeon]MBD3416610.1 PH domain-containing protein [Candidatus Altiarchaeales archaeon]